MQSPFGVVFLLTFFRLFSSFFRDPPFLQNSAGDASVEQSVRRLLASATLVNQAVGDALSDLLFCEAVLRLKGWGCQVTVDEQHRRTQSHVTSSVVERRRFTCKQGDDVFTQLPHNDIDRLLVWRRKSWCRLQGHNKIRVRATHGTLRAPCCIDRALNGVIFVEQQRPKNVQI